MSEILGYDVNGEPLRAGDRVVPVAYTKKYLGKIFTCRGCPENPTSLEDIEFEEVAPNGKHFQGTCRWLRKLKDDSPGKEHYKDQHKPCGQSFDELLKGFGRVEA